MLPNSFFSKHSNHWDYPDEPYVDPAQRTRDNIVRLSNDYLDAGLTPPRMTDQYSVHDAHVALQTIIAERKFA